MRIGRSTVQSSYLMFWDSEHPITFQNLRSFFFFADDNSVACSRTACDLYMIILRSVYTIWLEMIDRVL